MYTSIRTLHDIMSLYLPRVKKSKRGLDSEFHAVNSGFHAVDSGFYVLDSGFLVGGTWIPDSNRQRDSRTFELDSGSQSLGFQVTQGFRNQDCLTWGERNTLLLFLHYGQLTCHVSHVTCSIKDAKVCFAVF